MTRFCNTAILRLSALGAFAAASGAALPITAAKADPWSLPIASSPAATTVAKDQVSPAVRQLVAQIGVAAFTAPDWHPGTVRHIVLFRFNSAATAAQRDEVVQRYLRLVQDSRRPDGKPVVASIEAGGQNSAEGNSEGLQLGFITTFNSEGDRNFFVGNPVVTDPNFFDPAHAAFKDFARPYLVGAVVFDFDVAATVTRKPQARLHTTHKTSS